MMNIARPCFRVNAHPMRIYEGSISRNAALRGVDLEFREIDAKALGGAAQLDAACVMHISEIEQCSRKT